MRDNLEELTDIINMQLKSIKVSEELKLKTLQKCKESKKKLIDRGRLPIACTIAACLFMGVIIYPIYKKDNLMQSIEITMEDNHGESRTLDKPYMDLTIPKNETNNIELKNSETNTKEIVEENQKEANKNIKEEKQEKQIIVLNEENIMPFKMEIFPESEKEDESMLAGEKSAVVAINTDTSDKEKYTKADNGNSSLVLSVEKTNDLNSNEEVKMKTLSLQEAIKIFQSNIKIPSYVPKGFLVEKVLVPEVDSSSCELYEITYSSNSQHFKITEYKNINYTSILAENSKAELKAREESGTIININNIPVRYVLSESVDDKEPSYVRLTWGYMGKKYGTEGNVSWAEFINIISSIIK